MSENVQVENENVEVNAQARATHPLKRVVGGLLVVLWFTLLLTPCAFFYLAANGEIRIWHDDIPEPNAHPRLLVELVSEVDYRGLQLTRSYDVGISDQERCIQTDVTFYLWQSIEEDLDTSYCDCYQRVDSDASWELYETTMSTCPIVFDR